MGNCVVAESPVAIADCDAIFPVGTEIDYCACCGRIDRLDDFGICATCRVRPNVLEVDARAYRPDVRSGEAGSVTTRGACSTG